MAHVIHFHVPAEVVADADAKPMTSGGYPTNFPPEIAARMGFVPGQGAGKRYVVLCSPSTLLDEHHGASGEPWAVTCPKCWAHPYWEERIAKNPHPKTLAQANPQPEECC